MGELEQPPNYVIYPCFLDNCLNSSSCNVNCFDVIEPLPPPPPPPLPPSQSSSQTHFAPFLIAIVCILGISFLLLTTCTIILRVRFTRRRSGVSPANGGNSGVNDEDDDGFVDHPIWHITTVGLQQSVIDSITAFKFRKIDGFFVGGDDCSCSVCLTEFDDGDDLRLLPKCSHAFHVSCIDTWLRSHKNCPLCRAPVVNESVGVGGGHSVVNESDSGFGDEVLSANSDDHDHGDGSDAGEGSSRRLEEGGDDVVGRLPVLEGIKIAEVLNKNRENRVFSDLGENHRFSGVEVDDGGLEPVRRSVSFNGVAALSKCEEGSSNEGCSSEGRSSNEEGWSSDGNVGDVLQEKKVDVEKESNKKGLSMSGILMKSSSIGRSLQKGPVSMKRSLSSSSKFFSFRRSRSQASILPL